jgi:hypothetical protein
MWERSEGVGKSFDRLATDEPFEVGFPHVPQPVVKEDGWVLQAWGFRVMSGGDGTHMCITLWNEESCLIKPILCKLEDPKHLPCTWVSAFSMRLEGRKRDLHPLLLQGTYSHQVVSEVW